MLALEIILLVLGFLFVVISFVLVDHTSSPGVGSVKELQLTIEQEDELKVIVRDLVEEETEVILEDTEEKLNRISNEKIIAVSEFSEQVLEKINNNHQEVVFLYDMLQKKEEELKGTLRQLEVVKREKEDLINRLELNTKENETLLQRLEETRTGIEQAAAGRIKTPVSQMTVSKKMEPIKATSSAGSQIRQREQGASHSKKAAAPTEMSNNDRVLALYRQKRSIMEISKLLGMGQGEVKLVIDLYGH